MYMYLHVLFIIFNKSGEQNPHCKPYMYRLLEFVCIHWILRVHLLVSIVLWVHVFIGVVPICVWAHAYSPVPYVNIHCIHVFSMTGPEYTCTSTCVWLYCAIFCSSHTQALWLHRTGDSPMMYWSNKIKCKGLVPPLPHKVNTLKKKYLIE